MSFRFFFDVLLPAIIMQYLYDSVQYALKVWVSFKEIATSGETRAEVKAEARGLINYVNELETSLLLQLWNKVLERVNQTSIAVQKASVLTKLCFYFSPCWDLLTVYEKGITNQRSASQEAGDVFQREV